MGSAQSETVQIGGFLPLSYHKPPDFRGLFFVVTKIVMRRKACQTVYSSMQKKHAGPLVALWLLLGLSSEAFAQQSQPQPPVRPIPQVNSPVQAPVRPAPQQAWQHPSLIPVARLHYSGGGDWYWGNSAIPNLLDFVRENSSFAVDTIEKQVKLTDPDLFLYPFLFATGHGVIRFSPDEQERLRQYLQAGGFLFVNDSYGMADGFLREMQALYPERQVVDVPFDHPIYHAVYDFPSGPPKIHEHDNKPPRGYGLFLEGRLAIYFLVESDIGDGWEDPHVHNDPPEKRLQALRMGLNILACALLY